MTWTWQDCMPPWTDLDDPDYPGSPCMPEELAWDEKPIYGCEVMCLTCGAKDRTRPWWMWLDQPKALLA
ncbi:hypothetical protein Ssi03_13280 [Sphaerisporangium siamense]|uniref:Uncharacterized protein n=1 Tax=Sphaerisporangium siamense TaxID=795645 RepID=A0A7W7DAD1_9ACTN|nr:hypothetical protein [Sphaerisporangium siamense]MBB4702904.1 hypothetical protein [Sphaerisporangium siamense]GII83338.1 hypothetical protein Ssi03_13280 [Sphaerisporangium siamense]